MHRLTDEDISLDTVAAIWIETKRPSIELTAHQKFMQFGSQVFENQVDTEQFLLDEDVTFGKSGLTGGLHLRLRSPMSKASTEVRLKVTGEIR
jgi:hypothetical protein